MSALDAIARVPFMKCMNLETNEIAEVEIIPVLQACTTQKTRRPKLSTQICRRPQNSISFRCGDIVVVWKKFWNDNYLFEVELLQHFLQLRKLSRVVCCAGLLYCICSLQIAIYLKSTQQTNLSLSKMMHFQSVFRSALGKKHIFMMI